MRPYTVSNDNLFKKIMPFGRIDILEAEIDQINKTLEALSNNAIEIAKRRKQLVRDLALFYIEESGGSVNYNDLYEGADALHHLLPPLPLEN